METPWELIAKYLADETNEAENAKIEEWANSAKENAILLKKAKLFFQHKQNSGTADFSQFQQEDWVKLQQKTILTVVHKERWLPVWKVAAAISLVVVASAIIILTTNNKPSLEIATKDFTKEVWLSDSSYVLLNKDSRLVVESGYNKNVRQVSLEGEAFFKVKSNSKNPFSVSSFDVNTTVLGTEFNVKARTESSITVSVLKGKVKVTANTEQQLLTANMASIYNGNSLQLFANADLNYLAWKTRVIRFKGTTLIDAIEFLSMFYGETITLDKSVDPKTLITVELNKLTLAQALEVVTFTLDLQFKNEAEGYLIH